MSSEGSRLHRAAIGVLALAALREALLPLIVLLGASIAGRGLDTAALQRGAIYLVIGVAVASLAGFARWRSTSYAVDERGIHWRTGIFRTKSTTVPLSRIQGLDTVAGPVQRLFGVVALHVQSAGGGAKGEIVLDAVGPAAVERIRSGYEHRHAMVDALSAKIEMELGELEPEEAAVFMEELGLRESSLDRVIELSYRLVGLISFLTAGPDEVRAWPIPEGSNAVDAAGAIHSDLARGFIRAETIAYEDLLSLGSMSEAKKHGKVRSEGKTYRVRDGDVIEVLFSR